MIYILAAILVIMYVGSNLFMAKCFDYFTRLLECQLKELERKVDRIEKNSEDTSEAVEDLLSDQFEMLDMVEGYIEKGGAKNESY